MSRYPEALRQHLNNEATTVCLCWRLTLSDGTMSGFTDTDTKIEFEGTVFAPQTGFSASEAERSLGLTVDTVDIEGALSSAEISEEDIHSGRYDGARVDTFLVNWQASEQRALIRSAVIGRMTTSDGRFVAELESLTAYLDRPRGRYFRRNCDAELGDEHCKFDVSGATYVGAGTVHAVVGEARISVGGLAAYDGGWFAGGQVTWTSGQLTGLTSRVVSHQKAGGEVELALAAEAGGVPLAGDTFSVSAGCDKSFTTCKAKFANQLNFRGYPHLPGNDAAYAYATEGQVLDGSPIVP